MPARTPDSATTGDRLDPARAAALHALLARPGPPPGAGAPLPAFWHHAYFWQPARPEALGRDGHLRPGGLIPDTGLPRRMWGGGALEFRRQLVLGRAAERTSTVIDVTRKQGRSGALALVSLRHDYRQGGRLCLRETQDLLYLPDPAPGAAPPPPPVAPAGETSESLPGFDAVTLFRYSALTFNGHRIHYDRDYCRDVEGYPGLVVHGPLLAQLLIQAAQAQLGGLRGFRFRATAPLFDGEPATLCTRRREGGLELWIGGPGGRLCMRAEAR